MTHRFPLTVAVCASLAGPVFAAAPPPSPPPDAVAVVEGETITRADLEDIGGSQLFQLRNQEYNLYRQLVDEAIARKLVAREAKARGTTVDELSRLEVEEKVPPVTEAEQKDFYAKNKGRFGNATEEKALADIATGLRSQRVRQRRIEFVDSLRARSKFKVMLEPPRIKVDAGDDPSKGPATAPVTIVEFSDFQCPYCSRVNPTLKRLEERYKDKIRIVFRDFPLLQIHKDAGKAAEAAACAHEQGKFWAMHDKLFETQGNLDLASLRQRAVDIGLDPKAFNECLDSGKHTAEWQQDAKDAERYGVQSTPAFFINGRMVVGAVPDDQFIRVIDEELERLGHKPPAPAPSPAPTGGK